jgi:hypothetical protein
MRERIRYRKHSSGVMQSVRRYPHRNSGAIYQVTLDLEKMTWAIIESRSKLVVLDGTARTIHRLKIDAKDGLETLEISFRTAKRRKS